MITIANFDYYILFFQNEVTVAKPSRVAVIKPKQTNAPMKFKLDLPEDYMTHQNENYMQLSDSDDDDKPERGAFRQSRTGTAGGKKKGAATVAVTFKHEKPIIRERPESAKAFHSVSANDPELKVTKIFFIYFICSFGIL